MKDRPDHHATSLLCTARIRAGRRETKTHTQRLHVGCAFLQVWFVELDIVQLVFRCKLVPGGFRLHFPVRTNKTEKAVKRVQQQYKTEAFGKGQYAAIDSSERRF